MRKLLLIAVAVQAVAWPLTFINARARPVCTLSGTRAADVLTGGAGRDVVSARGGADIIDVSQSGRDVVRAGNGDDFINAQDGKGDDLVKAGSGQDTCFKDRGDRLRGCETVSK